MGQWVERECRWAMGRSVCVQVEGWVGREGGVVGLLRTRISLSTINNTMYYERSFMFSQIVVCLLPSAERHPLGLPSHSVCPKHPTHPTLPTLSSPPRAPLHACDSPCLPHLSRVSRLPRLPQTTPPRATPFATPTPSSPPSPPPCPPPAQPRQQRRSLAGTPQATSPAPPPTHRKT